MSYARKKIRIPNRIHGVLDEYQHIHPGADFHEEVIVLQPQTTINPAAMAHNAAQSQLDFHVYRTPGKRYYQMVLQFDLNESGGSYPVNVCYSPYFVGRIEYRTSGNELIQTIYNYNLLKNLNLLSDVQFRHWAKLMGINPETWMPDESTQIPASGTRRFFLPILGDLFSSNAGIPALWKDYFLIRLFLQDSVEGPTSSAGTLNIQQIALRINTRHEDGPVALTKPLEFNFVDYLSTVSGNYSLSSNEQKVLLQSLLGYDVEDDIVIGSSIITSTAYQGSYRNWISLGDRAGLAVYDSSGTNIVGGSVLDANKLRYIDACKHYSGEFFLKLPVYPVFYGKPEFSLQNGVIMGALYQDTHNQIGITGSPYNLAAPVLTVTPSGTSASGYYYIVFNDPISGQSCQTNLLAYNASASTIQAALYALPNWMSLQTVTVSGALTSAATFTFGGPLYANDYVYEIDTQTIQVIGVSTETSAPAAVTFATTYTTVGNNGFSSATNQVIVYSHIIRRACLHPDGMMHAYQLTHN